MIEMADEKEKPVSVRAFARMHKVSHPTVLGWMNSGRITNGVVVPNKKTGHRKILPSVANEELKKTDDPDKHYLRVNGGGSPPDGESPAAAKIPALAKVKAQKETILLQKAAIELQVMKGKLVEKETVYHTLFAFGKLLRENITGIPDRISDDLFAAKSRADIHRILSEELNRALEDLSDAEKLNF